MTRLKIGTLATNKILGWHSTPLWSNLLFKFFDSGWFHTQISKWRLSSWRDAAACTIGQRKRTVMQTTPPTKCFGKVEVLICFVIGQGVDIWSNNETSKWQALWIIMVYYGILWYIMVYYGILWYIMVYYGILWYIMVYCQGETVYGLRQ